MLTENPHRNAFFHACAEP